MEKGKVRKRRKKEEHVWDEGKEIGEEEDREKKGGRGFQIY